MACDHGMMLMSDHDDAYVNAMLMVNMQANTRSVTPATRLWCRRRLRMRGGSTWRRRGRSVSVGAVRSAWPLLWRSCPRGVNVASRRTLEDPVETRRHPLGVVAAVIAVSAVVPFLFFLFLSPWQTFASRRTGAVCHGRPRPPLPEASRTERRSAPAK